jgi:hypothetical protein
MKKLSLSFLMLFVTVGLFAQKRAKEIVNVTGNITTSVTWTADKIYVLSGIIRVADGATLTIEPGTVIKGGKAPDQSNATCLVIDRGGKINAIGTKEKPIIFTSNEKPGDRDYGDWGGLVIFGKAPVNKTNPQYEGGVIPGTYGGDVANDNSGTLKYVRIEFAGYPFEQDRELNSLTLCGVGSGTTIEYVQTSYNNDDAFEWFGGTVNAKYLVAYRTNDDDFDVDLGYSGRVQFGVSLADPNVADVSTKNGFEVDNDAGGSNDNPKTSAVFSNMTVIGAFKDTSDVRDNLHGRGAHIRRNNEISIFNSIIMGWREGIRMDGTNTFANFSNNVGFLQNIIMAGHKRNFNGAGGVSASDFQNFFDSTGNNNRKYFLNSQVNLKNPFNFSAPDFRPASGSPALTGASFANAKLAGGFFTTTTYVGAFSENDTWMDTWTEFDPVNADYDSIEIPTTNIAKIENALNFNIYPNPAKDQLVLSFDLIKAENVVVQIFNTNGALVKTLESKLYSAGAITTTIDVSDLNSGLYLINLNGDSFAKTDRLMIQQ